MRPDKRPRNEADENAACDDVLAVAPQQHLAPSLTLESLSAALIAAALSSFCVPSNRHHLSRCLSAVNPASRLSDACDSVVNAWKLTASTDSCDVVGDPRRCNVSMHIFAWWWSSSSHQKSCSPTVKLTGIHQDPPTSVLATLPPSFEVLSAERSEVGCLRNFFLQPRVWSGLTSLRLVDVHASTKGVDLSALVSALTETLSTSVANSLRCLEFSRSCLGDSGVIQLVPLLRACSALCELVFDCNQLGDQGAVVLADLALTDVVQREEVVLGGHDDSCNGASQGSQLGPPVVGLLQLESVSLRDNQIAGVGAAALFSAARRHPSWERLDLSNNRIRGSVQLGVLGRLLEYPSSAKRRSPNWFVRPSRLTSLSLASNDIWRDTYDAEKVTDKLVEAVQFLRPHHLKWLDLSGASIPCQDVRRLAPLFQCTPRLSVLRFENNNLGGVDALALVEALSDSPACAHLTTLSLHHNRVGTDKTVPFLQSLSNFPNLESLDLGNNSLLDSECGAMVAAAFVLPRLKRWYLDGLSFSTLATAEKFLVKLASHPALEMIRFAPLTIQEHSSMNAPLPKTPFFVC